MAGANPDSLPHQWLEIVGLLKLEELITPEVLERVGTAVSFLDDNNRMIEDRITLASDSAGTIITSPGVTTWDGVTVPAGVARGRIYYNSATDEYGSYDGTSIVPLGEDQGMLGFFFGED